MLRTIGRRIPAAPYAGAVLQETPERVAEQGFALLLKESGLWTQTQREGMLETGTEYENGARRRFFERLRPGPNTGLRAVPQTTGAHWATLPPPNLVYRGLMALTVRNFDPGRPPPPSPRRTRLLVFPPVRCDLRRNVIATIAHLQRRSVMKRLLCLFSSKRRCS